KCSLVSEEGDEAVGIRVPVATETLPGDLFAACEFVIGNVGIGRLLIVAIAVAAARGDHDGREIHIQPPSAKVQGGNSVISQLSLAPVPEPLPVVMNAVVVMWRPWGRSLPELVVDMRRRGGLLANSHGWPIVVVPAPRAINVADCALAQLGHGFDHARRAPALRAHLHRALVLARS